MNDTLALWIVTLAGLALAAWRALPSARAVVRARAAGRGDRPGLRLAGTLAAVGLHQRLLRLRLSGIAHLLIFAGFIVLFTAILEAFGSRLIPGFTLAPIGGNTWIALLQDLFALLVVAGIGLAAWQRLILKPARFAGSNQRDALVIYTLVLAVVVTMLIEFATDIVAGKIAQPGWRPVSSAIAAGMASAGLGRATAADASTVFYWLHIFTVLGFLSYIPRSKHRHIFLAAPAIYMRSLDGKGRLPAPAAGPVIAQPHVFTVKDVIDTLACTECGRCQDVCPAYAAGLPLSPKTLIMDLRDALIDPDHLPIAGGAIKAETLWACTTCRACMEACPVHIEHVPKIVDLRRALIEIGEVEPSLQEALSNLMASGNAMGKPAKMRARWTKGLSFKIKDARTQPVDVLWFVGDTASFDPRVEKITLRVAETLHSVGVDFGILYDGEHNSGNDVRRTGEEGLFTLLATHNIEVLKGCTFNRIMTTDPHSLNALRQEYALFGVNWPTLHYTTLIRELVDAGRLVLHPEAGLRVTYHDPCYLGRYNDEFESPRALIRAAGATLIEMGRCRENSFCCGAGGGRIWMDEGATVERPSENRIREAMALGGIDAFVVACPKDTVMYTAAVQNLGLEGQLRVMDVIDLVRPA